MREKLIARINSMPYTQDDLKLLLKILDGYFESQTKRTGSNTLWDVTDSLRMFLEEGFVLVDREREVNFYQYLFVYQPRIFLFMTLPIEQVCLYISDPILKLFVEWRLRIDK